MTTELEDVVLIASKDNMNSYIDALPEIFEQLVQLAISDKQPYAWRSAWLVWSCMEDNDARIQKHVKGIIAAISTKHYDHQRELIKILYRMELNDENQKLTYGLCKAIWEKINYDSSVRYNAFKMIVKIAQCQPDLANEVELLIQNQYLNALPLSAQKSINEMVSVID